ncbi:unnamed protein product [Withania somnifera]
MDYKKMVVLAKQEMDPKIWSKLPEDVLEYLLSFLPLKTFLKLRSTCKHFKTLLFSPPFISKHSPSPNSPNSSSPFSSFFLLSHPQFPRQYPLFDTVHNNWRNLSLCVSPVLPSSSSVLLSSSNGLLCFTKPSSSSFTVSNVLARSSRVVKFPTLPFSFESLALVCLNSNWYKLFVMSSVGSSSQVFVYDSLVHSWSQFGGFDLILNENHHQEGVFYDGCLCFITPEPYFVVCMDLDTGDWKRSNFELPNEVTFARLVSDGDKKLYLISGNGRNGISRSMKLWELDRGSKIWVEVENVPELICRKFLSVCYHNYEHVYCFWHKGLICVCCYSWPEILYYKVSRRTWHWLPKCPSLPDKWSCGFRWFSFVPELYAFV